MALLLRFVLFAVAALAAVQAQGQGQGRGQGKGRGRGPPPKIDPCEVWDPAATKQFQKETAAALGQPPPKSSGSQQSASQSAEGQEGGQSSGGNASNSVEGSGDAAADRVAARKRRQAGDEPPFPPPQPADGPDDAGPPDDIEDLIEMVSGNGGADGEDEDDESDSAASESDSASSESQSGSRKRKQKKKNKRPKRMVDVKGMMQNLSPQKMKEINGRLPDKLKKLIKGEKINVADIEATFKEAGRSIDVTQIRNLKAEDIESMVADFGPDSAICQQLLAKKREKVAERGGRSNLDDEEKNEIKMLMKEGLASLKKPKNERGEETVESPARKLKRQMWVTVMKKALQSISEGKPI